MLFFILESSHVLCFSFSASNDEFAWGDWTQLTFSCPHFFGIRSEEVPLPSNPITTLSTPNLPPAAMIFTAAATTAAVATARPVAAIEEQFQRPGAVLTWNRDSTRVEIPNRHHPDEAAYHHSCSKIFRSIEDRNTKYQQDACEVIKTWSDPARILYLDKSRREILRAGLSAFYTAIPEPEDLAVFKRECTVDMANTLREYWSDPARIFRLSGCHQETLRGSLDAFLTAYPEHDELIKFEAACKADMTASERIFHSIVDGFQCAFGPSLYDRDELLNRGFKKGIDSTANRKARVAAIESMRKAKRADIVKAHRLVEATATRATEAPVQLIQTILGVKRAASLSVEEPAHKKRKTNRPSDAATAIEAILEAEDITPVEHVEALEHAVDEEVNFGADMDEPLFDDVIFEAEPALTVGEPLFAGIEDEVVVKPRMLKEIECKLDGVYWAPVTGRRVRRAPVRS